MKLTRVTITGADDQVAPAALIELSRSYPFVEWALLGSKTRRGTPRFPSDHWMDGWMEARLDEPVDFRWAVHLCGELARRALSGCQRIRGWLHTLARPAYSTPRVQLNGFSNYRIPLLAIAEQMPGWEFILQTADLQSEFRGLELAKIHPNVVNLLDASGGRGEVAIWAERPEKRLGYAGGIGPDNVVEQLEHLLSFKTEQDFWIDMESGVRTDDRFDLDKVRRVLDLAAPFVSKEQP